MQPLVLCIEQSGKTMHVIHQFGKSFTSNGSTVIVSLRRCLTVASFCRMQRLDNLVLMIEAVRLQGCVCGTVFFTAARRLDIGLTEFI